MNDKAYLHHMYYKVKNRIQRENQIIPSDQDVHQYGYGVYGKVDTRPEMGARYYHTCIWWELWVDGKVDTSPGMDTSYYHQKSWNSFSA